MEGHSLNPGKAQTASCYMAATDTAVETITEASGNTASENDLKNVKVINTTSEVTVSEDSSLAKASGKAQVTTKLASNDELINAKKRVIPQDKKDDTNMDKPGTHSSANSGVECDAGHSNDVIGATISFGLGQNSAVSGNVEEKVKHGEKNAVINTNSHRVPTGKKTVDNNTKRNKQLVSSPAPHSAEELLSSAAELVGSSTIPENSTCPEPAFIDSEPLDHADAVALNFVSGSRDVGGIAGVKDSIKDTLPVEREMQPLTTTKEDSGESVGLFRSSNGKKNYGSIESPEAATPPATNTISSPEEEISPTASSTTDARDDVAGAVGPGVQDEPTKKKRKRKKKKKANADADADHTGAANSSDHENKVLTSPGTSGAEDSSKTLVQDTVPQSSVKPKTTLNGPSTTQSKMPALSNKSKKTDNKTENNAKRQSNNTKKQTDLRTDDVKTALKSERFNTTVGTIRADRPKTLNVSNNDDALRTTYQSTDDKKISNEKSGIVEGDKMGTKGDDVSDNESESGNDGEKSSEDASVKVSQESSMDENFRDEDESNGNEWQTYGQKKSKRRVLAAEDRYPFLHANRSSFADNPRRPYYSGPFDPKLRKSSSEPSGMSKWMDVSDSRPAHRHASFSRHHYLRDEFHSLSCKQDPAPTSESTDKPPLPVSANSYAAKLKAKPPVAPNGSKKSQENQPGTGDQQDSANKPDASKMLPPVPTPVDHPPRDDTSEMRSTEGKDLGEARSTTSSTTGELDSQPDLSDVPAKAFVSGTVSAAVAAKSASLPRDMGRKPGTELPKLDNTSADNVVQYLDLQCSNDTYAARLKQSINKPADAKVPRQASCSKQEKPVASVGVKPPRTSKLENSHKAVSLDSAQPVQVAVPKKTSSVSSKDKDSMRTVKSDTNLNLTSEGSTAMQDNSFPFEAEPAASFDITFGSVKFCESDFELLDDVAQSNQQSKAETGTKRVPQCPISNQQKQTVRKSPPPPPNQVSCADLEKEWFTKSPQNDIKHDRQDYRSNLDNASSVPLVPVPAGLAAILASGNTNKPPLPKMGENNNVKKKPGDHYWTAGFNHSELADMLLKDWELTTQSSKVVVYEEE